MKYRYLIEHSADPLWPFHATTVDPEGTAQGSGRNCETLEEAKAYCQDGAMGGDEGSDEKEGDWGQRVTLVWKDPPAAWQPDVICVSQYLTEMYPGLST